MRLYAHRGASAERPENTVLAFRRAIELGADALETDAWLTRDGHVVLSHDANGRRMAGLDRDICQSTLEEVRSWDAGWGFVNAEGRRPFAGQGVQVPTLDDVLEAFPGMPVNLDVKQPWPDMVPPLLRTIRRHRAEERVLLASFSSSSLRRIRRLGYAGPTGLGRTEVARIAFLPEAILRWMPPAGRRVQVPLRAAGVDFAREAFLQKCHALGLQVDFWTIDDAVDAARLAAMGADGIMSNDPGAIAVALGKGPRAVTSRGGP